MPVNLLCISAEPVSSSWEQVFKNYNFDAFYARGKLKVKQILQTERIQCILWQYTKLQHTFAQDIIDTLNQFPLVPVVVASYEPGIKSLDLIQSTNKQIDLNDKPDLVCNAINFMINTLQETQPNQDTDASPLESEIVFRHKIKQSLQTPKQELALHEKVPVTNFWLGVKPTEKQLLHAVEESPSLLRRFKKFWKK